MPYEREEERERIEDDIGLAILCQRLHLRRLHPRAPDPDYPLDEHRSRQGPDRQRWKRGRLPRFAWQQFGYGLLQDLEEGDYHYDAEYNDAQGLETTASDGEFVLQAFDLPGYELGGGENYEGAEEVEGGVDKGGDQGEGGGLGGGNAFCCEEEDVGYDIDLDSLLGLSILN